MPASQKVSALIQRFPKALGRIKRDGRYPFEEMLANYYYPFEKINDVLDSMARLEAIKPAIVFDQRTLLPEQHECQNDTSAPTKM